MIVLLLIFCILIILGLLVDFFFLPSKKSLPKSRNEYLKLVQSIVYWCEHNISLGRQRKVKVKIKISYQKNGNFLGWYDYSTKIIMVYVLKHNELKSLANTTIHEYVHHLQLRTIKDDIRYKSITNIKGYWENDYEREARILAKKYTNKCIRDLKL